MNTLESLSLFTSFFVGKTWPLATSECPLSLSCLNLRHLTFALSAGCISDYGIWPSQLTSLHVVVDTASWIRESADNTACRPETFPNLASLRHYTISGTNGHVPAATILVNVSPIMQHSSRLLSLTVRDMKVVVDISYVSKLESKAHIGLVVFDNVQYCMADEITLSGPSEPKELDERCKPYVELVGHADQSRIISGTP
jgi:hypothetical protein